MSDELLPVECPKCGFKDQKPESLLEVAEAVQCPECGYTFCGKPTEVYSRIVGYHRPVKNWNKGKREEFGDRKLFSVSKIK